MNTITNSQDKITYHTNKAINLIAEVRILFNKLKSEGIAYPTKAKKRDELEKLNTAYRNLYNVIQEKLLLVPYDLRNAELDEGDTESPIAKFVKGWNALYWEKPNYPFLWKTKHSKMFKPGFSKEVNMIEEIVKLRTSIVRSENHALQHSPTL